MPLIATNVGGIPEVFGPDVDGLLPPGDPAALAHAIDQAMRDPGARRLAAQRLRARVAAAFSADAMADAVLAAYREALSAHALRRSGEWIRAPIMGLRKEGRDLLLRVPAKRAH